MPSGTLWKTTNEHNANDEHGLFSFYEAEDAFGTQVPSKAQWQELIDNCTWDWKETGFEVSRNGQSIFLPGEGYYKAFFDEFVAPPTGNYCSSTKDGGNAYHLNFVLPSPQISTTNTSDKISVRLVRNAE